MKNKIKPILAAAALLAVIACSEKKDAVSVQDPTDAINATDTITAVNDTAKASVPPPAIAEGTNITVKGVVTEIINGKDGYMAKIKDEQGKLYTATISIPNMTDPKQFRAVKIGETITVSGTTFVLGEETGVKVNTLE
ncbi:hypothetical protein GR160_04710 [Flavobacterium sp. Sd200]|uniref:hypothetical protein n=1 Tax=Flavobacterium sp. Sd200 TaxID=2692211 RepID=UPI001370ABE5|nr:hypothetical protein [Flavobacterium sp. Sd200]MXN90518.1 hypothetical protein [Flavobacterium sp. Sd200]